MSPTFEFLVKIDEIYVTSRHFREMSGTLQTKYLGGQCFIANDLDRLKIMRKEAKISKSLEDIMTLQEIEKHKNIEE